MDTASRPKFVGVVVIRLALAGTPKSRQAVELQILVQAVQVHLVGILILHHDERRRSHHTLYTLCCLHPPRQKDLFSPSNGHSERLTFQADSGEIQEYGSQTQKTGPRLVAGP